MNAIACSTPVRILRAAHLGMCFGVRDAIALARSTVERQPLTVLGDLVHNETVLSDLRQRGIRFAEAPGDPAAGSVMITAHGTSDRRRDELAARGFDVIESTCPLVRHAHGELSRLVARGLHPVVIGRRDHVEVRGLTGDYETFDVILSEADIDTMIERPGYGVVAQTTQPIARVRQLVERLRERFPRAEVVFRDTVCQPTKQRQRAALDLAGQCDVVVVVGGAQSNNTRELVQTCRERCTRVYQVTAEQELRAEWFRDASCIGLTAGTSTPDELIQRVEKAVQQLTREAV